MRSLKIFLKKDCYLDSLDVRVNFSHLNSIGRMIMLAIDYDLPMYKLNAVLCSNHCDNKIISASKKRKKFCSDANYVSLKFDSRIIIRQSDKFNKTPEVESILDSVFEDFEINLSDHNHYFILEMGVHSIYKLAEPIVRNFEVKKSKFDEKKIDTSKFTEKDFSFMRLGELAGVKIPLNQDNKKYMKYMEALKVSEFDSKISKVNNIEEMRAGVRADLEILKKDWDLKYYTAFSDQYMGWSSDIDDIMKPKFEEIRDLLEDDEIDGTDFAKKYIKMKRSDYLEELRQIIKLEKKLTCDVTEPIENLMKKKQNIIDFVDRNLRIPLREKRQRRKELRGLNKKVPHISKYAFNRREDKYPIKLENQYDALEPEDIDELSDYDDDMPKYIEEEPKCDHSIIPNKEDYESAFNVFVQMKNVEEIFIDVGKRKKQVEAKNRILKGEDVILKSHIPNLKGKNYFGLLAKIMCMIRSGNIVSSEYKDHFLKSSTFKYVYGNVHRVCKQINLKMFNFEPRLFLAVNPI